MGEVGIDGEIEIKIGPVTITLRGPRREQPRSPVPRAKRGKKTDKVSEPEGTKSGTE